MKLYWATIYNPILCDLVDSQNKLDLAVNSSKIKKEEKVFLSIGSCIVAVEENKYVVYSKELFDNNVFVFID